MLTINPVRYDSQGWVIILLVGEQESDYVSCVRPVIDDMEESRFFTPCSTCFMNHVKTPAGLRKQL